MSRPAPLPQPAEHLFALLRGEAATDGDWDSIGVYALATGLGPLLLRNAENQLPPMVAARLRLAGRRTEARNQAIMAGLATLLHACNAESLPVIIFKGAYLAPAIYGDLSLRGMSDIDLLVQPQHFPQLQSALDDLGYEGKFTDAERGPGIVKHEWTYKLAGDDVAAANPYLSGVSGHHLEPHTSLTESWFGLTLDITSGVWERAMGWKHDGARALTLSPADAILHGAVHIVFHLLMGKPALLQLYDLRQLLEAHPDLDFGELLARAQTANAAAHLLAALNLSRTAYAAPVPDVWLEQLTAASPARQRRQAEQLDLPTLWSLTQQPPLNTLQQRLARGLSDRALAASWARNRSEALRVWSSAIAFHRTDTAAILGKRFRSRNPLRPTSQASAG